MADYELVERRARRHEDSHRPGASTRPAQLLPGRGDSPGVPDQHRGLEGADVDAELQSVGAHHAGDLAVAQAGLDLAAVERQGAGPGAAPPLVRVEAGGAGACAV